MSENGAIAVVGAGITGLSAAWKLAGNGKRVVVYERRERVGGAIRSEREGEWLLEYGPNTIQVKEPAIMELFEELGLGDRLLRAGGDASKRYIVRDGRLTQVPVSPSEWLNTPLFSKRALLRLAGEAFISRGRNSEETLASFVKRRIGGELLDYAVNPFVAGVYAGDPATLSVRHAFPRLYELEQRYGSLTLGALRSLVSRKRRSGPVRALVSFRDGLQELPLRLASAIPDLRTGTTVERVQRAGTGWEVIAGGVKSGPYERVLMNIPLYHFSEQLVNGGGALLEAVRFASYAPLSIVATGYRRENIDHPLDGFGYLVPEVENRSVLGTLFSSSLFPGRAPEGHVLLTTFVGGARQPKLAAEKSESLKKTVCRELGEFVGAKGEPVWFDHIYWPHAIPNYTVDYGKVLEAIDLFEESHPGVHLAGNFRGGISLPDCIANGLELAGKILGERPDTGNS